MGAQRGQKSVLPAMYDLAAAIRAGETTSVDIAITYSMGVKYIGDRLRRAGWDADTGQPLARPKMPALVREADDTQWQDRAACIGHDPELWYAEIRGADISPAAKKALEICEACPVRESCAEWALRNEGSPRFGIWGALMPGQRGDLATRKAKAEAVIVGSCPVCGDNVYRPRGRGGLRVYCSTTCAKTAYRNRTVTGVGHANKAKTHCVRGHEFDIKNTRIGTRKDGGKYRVCRTCERMKKEADRVA